MLEVTSHLVRRGLEGLPLNQFASVVDDGDVYEIPTAFVVVGSITLAIFLIIMWLFQYAYYNVFLTLCMIEQQTASAIVLNDDTNEGHGASDEEILIVKNKPITSSIFGLAKHLRTIGGRLAPFRGFWIYFTTQMIVGAVSQLVAGMIPFSRLFLSPLVGATVATLLLARWLMAWTHIVISEPSPLRWWKRIPSAKTWMKILPATLLFAVARQLSILLPLAVATISGLTKDVDDLANMKAGDARLAMGKSTFVLLVSVLCNIILAVPAHFVLVRTHASMLPEETESIIPYDRSYNGKVVPEVVGGTGCLKLVDAIKTIDKSSFVRLFVMYVKIFALQALVTLCFVAVFGIQFAIAIPHLHRRAPKDGEIHN